MAFLILTILLVAFSVLAFIDGFYLHIFKYQLFNHRESRFEHLTHTYRALLFPLIVFFLFISQNCLTSFYIGVFLVVLDILVLTIDAFVEKDSRVFMGGLPRWEYILHLFVNGFHFAAIAIFFGLKLKIANEGLIIIPDLSSHENFDIFHFVSINLLPGAVLLALIHIVTYIKITAVYWNKIRVKIYCC